jgi:hypothetical protein
MAGAVAQIYRRKSPYVKDTDGAGAPALNDRLVLSALSIARGEMR